MEEQDLRREAMRRYMLGERPSEICRALKRSTRWFRKWRAVYQADPNSDLADQSRAPRCSPHAYSDRVKTAVIKMREQLEVGRARGTYGLIGARVIQDELERLKIRPIPSEATIQRTLQQVGLTHPVGVAREDACYPWLSAWAVNAIQATDIIVRHIRGRGRAEINHFHTFDHFSHAVCLTQHADKRSSTTCEHLKQAWKALGMPMIHQFDNEASFCGGRTHVRVIGQVVRLCLFCGVEPIFIPYYEPKRNYQVETFHSLWCQAFWTQHEFVDLPDVQHESPKFHRWYHTRYHPPALNGFTPARMRQEATVCPLDAHLASLLPTGRLPITAGSIHFMRKVHMDGCVDILNEHWLVDKRLVGEYVRLTVDTLRQRLSIWRKADPDSSWRLLKTRAFRLKETTHELLPAFRRNPERCRDCLPA